MASTRIRHWAVRAGRLAGRGRRGFRRWRRGRPFWGGLFTLLGGAEILLLPVVRLPLVIQVGVAGISGFIAGVLMVVMGLAVWFAPHYRVFAGIATILFSLGSFLTSNLGGFLLGMLLGLLGGSLSCAWVPVRPGPDERPAPGPPPTGEDGIAGTGAGSQDGPEGGSQDGPEDGAEGGGGDGGGDGEVAGAGAGAAPDPAEPARSAAPRPADDPADDPAHPAHPASSAPVADRSAGARRWPPAGRDEPRLPLLALAVVALLVVTVAGPAHRPRLAADGLPTIASAVSTMHASTVDMSALAFDGVVDVPTLNGPLRTLKFSMGQLVMRRYTLSVPGGTGAGPITLSVGTLTLAGNVSFYTTRMSGLLSGAVPVTFTPDTPPPVVLPTTSFTDFSSEQVFVSSGTLTADGLGELPGTA